MLNIFDSKLSTLQGVVITEKSEMWNYNVSKYMNFSLFNFWGYPAARHMSTKPLRRKQPPKQHFCHFSTILVPKMVTHHPFSPLFYWNWYNFHNQEFFSRKDKVSTPPRFTATFFLLLQFLKNFVENFIDFSQILSKW